MVGRSSSSLLLLRFLAFPFPPPGTGLCLFPTPRHRGVRLMPMYSTTATTGKVPREVQVTLQGKPVTLTLDDYSNTPPHILARIGRDLHRQPHHPLHILKQRMESAFPPSFHREDALAPVVTTTQNFDSLGIPKDHPSWSKSDTYFLTRETLLRPQTSAHQVDLLRQGFREFLVSGDVYRRDEIDPTHYPVFHQMEGVKLMQTTDESEVVSDLKSSLERMVFHVFGTGSGTGSGSGSGSGSGHAGVVTGLQAMRWVEAYFPFTHPSWELEILYQGKWLEVLGCGVIHPNVLKWGGITELERTKGWAFGVGLERLAMALFKIPDIRLFWSASRRFLGQFHDDMATSARALGSYELKALGGHPLKDFPASKQVISFWTTPAKPTTPLSFVNNDLFDLVRTMGWADLVEEVTLKDEFTHPKSGRHSKAFELIFRSPEKTLTLPEINAHMAELRAALTQAFPHCQLR